LPPEKRYGRSLGWRSGGSIGSKLIACGLLIDRIKMANRWSPKLRTMFGSSRIHLPSAVVSRRAIASSARLKHGLSLAGRGPVADRGPSLTWLGGHLTNAGTDTCCQMRDRIVMAVVAGAVLVLGACTGNLGDDDPTAAIARGGPLMIGGPSTGGYGHLESAVKANGVPSSVGGAELTDTGSEPVKLLSAEALHVDPAIEVLGYRVLARADNQEDHWVHATSCPFPPRRVVSHDLSGFMLAPDETVIVVVGLRSRKGSGGLVEGMTVRYSLGEQVYEVESDFKAGLGTPDEYVPCPLDEGA
jgi:hypothetical protein